MTHVGSLCTSYICIIYLVIKQLSQLTFSCSEILTIFWWRFWKLENNFGQPIIYLLFTNSFHISNLDTSVVQWSTVLKTNNVVIMNDYYVVIMNNVVIYEPYYIWFRTEKSNYSTLQIFLWYRKDQSFPISTSSSWGSYLHSSLLQLTILRKTPKLLTKPKVIKTS